MHFVVWAYPHEIQLSMFGWKIWLVETQQKLVLHCFATWILWIILTYTRFDYSVIDAAAGIKTRT